MSDKPDTIEHDEEWDVHRIRTGDGVLLGTEYGGLPLGFDFRHQAEETVELRAERAEHRRGVRKRLPLSGAR